MRGHNTSSTSIFVTWDDVPAADKNGIITSYNITYHSLTEDHSNSTTVDHPDRQVTLMGLREFVNYSITVFASTVKGNGPESDPVIISTGEDSEYFRFWINVVRCLSEISFYLLTLSSPVPELIYSVTIFFFMDIRKKKLVLIISLFKTVLPSILARCRCRG